MPLDELGIPRKRNNLDKVRNGYGNKLLKSCKGNSLFLLNGRGLTSKKLSTVDYCLCSVKRFKWVNNFRILEFSSLNSDVRSITYHILKNCVYWKYRLCHRPKCSYWKRKKEIGVTMRNMQKLEQTLNRITLIIRRTKFSEISKW